VLSWKGTAIQRRLEARSRGIVIVRSRHQAATSEDIADWKILSVCSNKLQYVEIGDDAIIKCVITSCVNVVSKSNIQCKTPSRVRMIKFRNMMWTRHLINMEGSKYEVLVGIDEGKEPLGRPKNGWENSIKFHCKEILGEGVIWNFWLRRDTGLL
jgi:hypothetical protein